MTLDKPNKGDLVEIEWFDAFRYTGELPDQTLSVKSFGLFEFENEDGVAIVQNEVQTDGKFPQIDRVMDAQFILSSTIISIIVVREAN
jgi:hypothetical protein